MPSSPLGVFLLARRLLEGRATEDELQARLAQRHGIQPPGTRPARAGGGECSWGCCCCALGRWRAIEKCPRSWLCWDLAMRDATCCQLEPVSPQKAASNR